MREREREQNTSIFEMQKNTGLDRGAPEQQRARAERGDYIEYGTKLK